MYSIMYWNCIVSESTQVEIDTSIEGYLSGKASSISPKYFPEEGKVVYLKEKEVN